MKKCDLHIHTVPTFLDGAFNFSLEVLEKYVQKMELDAIAITNHNIFDMGNYMAIKDRLPNCTVLPGIEVDLEGGHILVISNPDDVELYDFSIRCDSVSRKITSPEDTLRLNEFYTIFPNLSKYLLIPHYDKKPYIPKNIISALSDYIFAGEVTSVKKFLYENNQGWFKRDSEGWVEVNKMTKDDLYDLVNWALSEGEFIMTPYDEALLQNPAHKTIYSHIYRQLQDIRQRREEFNDEIGNIYKEAYEKYCSD